MAPTVTLALAGDVMLGRVVDHVMAERGPAYPWGNLRPVLQQADAVLINLECALTTQHQEWMNGARKAFYFRTEPDRGVACLEAGRVAFASLANNHAGDFGTTGLLDTVAALESAGIAHAGAGRTARDASNPARLEVDGVRMAVLAFADHPATWAATPSSPGINYLSSVTSRESLVSVQHAIAMARAEADVVVCSLHWGPNMRLRPTPGFCAFAHRVIEAGADVVFGHSAHVVQGIEIFQGKPILYDTGDVVDDYAVDPELRNDLSALFLLGVTSSTITSLELLPVHINRCQVNLATGPDREWFASRLTTLCAEFGTNIRDDGMRLEVRLPDPGWSE